MSIEVTGLTKSYGSQLAVNDVSFSVGTGEIVGFIGPNGAGKSTTMKMITGTLRPDRGKASIKGMDVALRQKEVRQILGYLPEHNPLYLDMYIREYLSYVAKLYRGNSPGNTGAKVEDVIVLTGLEREARKKIGSLSKGYRQRVGLAQALIHDPEILILDEPTTGLDPNQLDEIRGLISRIGEKKTVLLSTHIMQEVEAICHRVIIIHQGKIVADDRSSELREGGSQTLQTILVEVDSPMDPERWEKIGGISSVRALEGNQFLLETREERDIRGDVFKFAVNQDITILSLSLQQRSLEEVFREITKS
jgi:ABC-2 type transport system ATP-binding protein